MRTFCLFLFLLIAANVFACKCESQPFTMEGIKQYELIFTGTVVAISGCDKTSKATFTVNELYKGKCFENVAVEFDCSSSCGMSFQPGETWIIFATYKKYGEPEVNLCSHSRRKFADEKDDFYLQTSGLSFIDAATFLKKNLGIHAVNTKNVEAEQHHENIRPDGSQTLLYLGAGLLALVAFYFLGRKFFK
ncbi:hypothetical protein BH11BAC7_BH11BAC7_33720 [soil metagenome]